MMIFSKKQIVEIFRRELHINVISAEQILNGNMTTKYNVLTVGKEYILRVYPKERSYIANKEFAILKKIENSVKVPKVLSVRECNDLSYIIYQKVEGNSLKFHYLKDVEKNTLIKEIGDNINALSKVTFGFYGSLTENEDRYDNWKSYLKQNIELGFKYLADTNLIDAPIQVILKDFMMQTLSKILVNEPKFVWSDLSQDNIIIINDQLSGFIDFEGSFAGDPILCIGYLFAVEGDSDFFNLLKEECWHGIPMSQIYFYAIFRMIRIVKFIDKPFPTGNKRDNFFQHFTGIKKAIDFLTKNN